MTSLKHLKQSILPFFVTALLLCFGLLPLVQGAPQVAPAPDGCYPNYTTAEGCKALQSLTTGLGNTGVGWYSLFSDTTGNFNTALGAGALVLNTADSNTATGAAALLLNTTGTENTAMGTDAMVYNDTGSDNTAVGAFCLFSNTTGTANTASGDRALFSNTQGNFNTATGFFALNNNTMGVGNTANGASALQHNTTGGLNTAVGGNALLSNTTGTENTATGANALFSNINGEDNTAVGSGGLQANNADGNTAIGSRALSANTTGVDNTAAGLDALQQNTSGGFNTAIGESALFNNTQGSSNTAVGDGALFSNTASHNTALGFGAGSNVSTASNVICVGTVGMDTSNSCFIGQIFNSTIGGGTPVLVNSNDQLGTAPSSKRFKEGITPMDDISEALFCLNPVTFHYKKELDPEGIPQFGLVAEDVEKVNPDLVVRDKEGKAYSVRYDQVNAMLLNEFLKEHRKIEAQEVKIREQESSIARLKNEFETRSAQQQNEMRLLTQQLKQQAAQIERVGAKLDTRDLTPASEVVVNGR